MTDNDMLRQLNEDRQRLANLTGVAVGAELERHEKLRREAMRAMQGTGALATLFSQKRALADVLGQMKPLQAFYENAGISRLISESAFAARAAMPSAFDSTKWLSSAISQMYGQNWQKQLAGIDIAHSVVSEQLKMISGTFADLDFGTRFAEQLAGPMRQLQELFDGYDEDERRVLKAIVPLGWLISPSMGMQTIRGLAAELDARTVEEIDDALIRYFNPEKCAEIVSGLYNDPALEELQPLIDESLAVHAAGHYRVAILGWLAAIDGVAARKFGVRKLYGELKKKNGGKFRLAIEQTSSGRESLNDALIEILKRVSMTKVADPHVPQRDDVMHGREIDFGHERASIQLILVLEVMHFCEPVASDGIAAFAGRP